MMDIKSVSGEGETPCATGADFCRIFTDDMRNLYLLSFVLIADPEKAEQCFVAGLDDCANGNRVFKERARSWAKRVIIKNAIRMMEPASGCAIDALGSTPTNRIKHTVGDGPRSAVPSAISAVLDLQPFERFVFVMSVFEGYSDRDSALLLGCTCESLVAARVRALQGIVIKTHAAGVSQFQVEAAEPRQQTARPKLEWLQASACRSTTRSSAGFESRLNFGERDRGEFQTLLEGVSTLPPDGDGYL